MVNSSERIVVAGGWVLDFLLLKSIHLCVHTWSPLDTAAGCLVAKIRRRAMTGTTAEQILGPPLMDITGRYWTGTVPSAEELGTAPSNPCIHTPNRFPTDTLHTYICIHSVQYSTVQSSAVVTLIIIYISSQLRRQGMVVNQGASQKQDWLDPKSPPKMFIFGGGYIGFQVGSNKKVPPTHQPALLLIIQW